MKAFTYVAALALLAATAACSDMSARQNPVVPFDNGLRPNAQAPTNCSPADSTCGSGLGNPSVQSPTQKHELNASPQ